jgi:hypothetical protein
MTKKIKHKVFNSTLDKGYFNYPKISETEEREIFADLFEQIMLFDKIYLKAGRANYALFLLIKNLGLDLVERLIEINYINFIFYTPIIVTSQGRQREDGTIDESTIYGQPPIASGTIEADSNLLEQSIDTSLSFFGIDSKRKKSFKKKIFKSYIVPDGMEFSTNSTKIVLDAYANNQLEALGLSNNTEPNQMDLEQRYKLLDLSHNVLETALLSTYDLKGFNNVNNFNLIKSNFETLSSALNVTSNGTKLFELENIPNLKKLFLEENLSFEQALKLRHNSNAKFFRNWLNTKSETSDSLEITEEYLNEIKGKNNFFSTTQGKFIRTVSTVGIGAGLSMAVGNPIPSLAIGILNSVVLDNLLKGKKPSAFIESVKSEVKKK